MELFQTISNKELVMHSIKVLDERIEFLDALVASCDYPEVKEKLSGLLSAYYHQLDELSMWFAKHYSVVN